MQYASSASDCSPASARRPAAQVVEVISPEWEEGKDPTVKQSAKRVKRKGQAPETVLRCVLLLKCACRRDSFTPMHLEQVREIKPIASFFNLFANPQALNEQASNHTP